MFLEPREGLSCGLGGHLTGATVRVWGEEGGGREYSDCQKLGLSRKIVREKTPTSFSDPPVSRGCIPLANPS